MKTFRDIALALSVALVLPALAGCAVQELETRLDEAERQWEAPLQQAEDVIDRQLDQVEDKFEAAIVGQTPENKPAADGVIAPAATKAPVTASITKEEAESIALAHAGLAAADVTGLRTEYEVDDRVPEYEVDFRQGQVEYDYTIHAQTGEILKFDKDEPKTAVTTTKVPEATKAPVTAAITKEKAESIALAHAGLTVADVTGLRTEYEVDDRVPEYEVDFRQGQVEYEYTIHAETGEILKAEKDLDD